ncbi:hypothetical protein H924_13520 (plasmid) [Corynebacterium callunae DSM 20147]|uniref:Secreted protein n=2 Tax=Corynebacterium callunae TaxID=1721 RepID=M1V0Z6_9CORY|nr:hypothetical protein H924_13520 [Corynebacterium callunae DSM 20147]
MKMLKRWPVVATVLTALALGACSPSPEKLAEQGSDVGLSTPPITTWEQPALPAPFTDVDQSNPDDVAQAVVTELFRWKPQEGDLSPADAAERATALMTESCIARYKNSWSAMMGLPGSLWQSWMEAHTTPTTTVTEARDPRPADEEMRSYRQYAVTVVADNPTPTTITYNVMVVVDKLGWWQVSDIRIDPPVIT